VALASAQKRLKGNVVLQRTSNESEKVQLVSQENASDIKTADEGQKHDRPTPFLSSQTWCGFCLPVSCFLPGSRDSDRYPHGQAYDAQCWRPIYYKGQVYVGHMTV
jgi:hypothetical protein